MDDKSRRLLRVYFQLNESERTEVNAEIDKFRRGDRSTSLKTLSERVEKMDLGPMGGACPYCGK